MSIVHSLDMKTAISEDAIREILADSKLGLSPARRGHFIAEGVEVWLREIRLPREDRRPVFGFVPNRSIAFHIYYSENEENGERITAQVTADLLAKEPGDAVLLWNGETPMVKRINGEIVAYEGWSENVTPALDAAGLRYVTLKHSKD
jgi:hypothetical protein